MDIEYSNVTIKNSKMQITKEILYWLTVYITLFKLQVVSFIENISNLRKIYSTLFL